MISFLLDEHLTRRIQIAVWHRRAMLDVLRVGDVGAPPYGSDDPSLLRYAEQAGRMFITSDRQTLRGSSGHITAHLMAGGHTWGVAFVRPSAPLGSIADTLVLIAEASAPDDWRDQEIWIPF